MHVIFFSKHGQHIVVMFIVDINECFVFFFLPILCPEKKTLKMQEKLKTNFIYSTLSVVFNETCVCGGLSFFTLISLLLLIKSFRHYVLFNHSAVGVASSGS